jgi:nucleotide-binding universal stress UspA family protein
LVHLPDEARADAMLSVAMRLAARHDAHLIGLYVMPNDTFSPALATARRIVDAGKNTLRDKARKIAARFEAAGAGLQIKKEWRFIEPGRQSCVETIIRQTRSADLVIVPQRQPTWADSLLLEHPEDIIMASGRPTLLVPWAGTFAEIGKRILVAWNDRREAARATFDALPFLREADNVRILWVNPSAATNGHPIDLPTVEIASALSRHGVRCTTAESQTSDLNVGNELLNQVSDHGIDLVVMGAYGRSRFREFVFGGATRVTLKSMTVPVLFSH